jgi:hypothetical protein
MAYDDDTWTEKGDEHHGSVDVEWSVQETRPPNRVKRDFIAH